MGKKETEKMLKRKWRTVSLSKRQELVAHVALPKKHASLTFSPFWESIPKVFRKQMVKEEMHWKVFSGRRKKLKGVVQ